MWEAWEGVRGASTSSLLSPFLIKVLGDADSTQALPSAESSALVRLNFNHAPLATRLLTFKNGPLLLSILSPLEAVMFLK